MQQLGTEFILFQGDCDEIFVNSLLIKKGPLIVLDNKVNLCTV